MDKETYSQALVPEGHSPSDLQHATPEEMARAIWLFKVLSHPERLRLACALGDGRVTTQRELVKEFGWPQSTAARHIGALRSAGLVTAERDGVEVLLRLGNPVALHLLETVCAWVHDDQRQRAFFSDPAFTVAPQTPSVVGTQTETARTPDGT